MRQTLWVVALTCLTACNEDPASDAGTGSNDARPTDAAPFDATGHEDGGSPDAREADASMSEVADATPLDAEHVDAGLVDAGITDTGTSDADITDLGPLDAEVPDAEPVDAAPRPDEALVTRYCNCVFLNCHDLYHEVWGEDEVTARLTCLEVGAELPLAEMPVEQGDAIECRLHHCALAVNEPERACPAALGQSLCVEDQ
ncbi:MAG: hypothetical protein ACE366_02390 [Bradymonadia bacterium]